MGYFVSEKETVENTSQSYSNNIYLNQRLPCVILALHYAGISHCVLYMNHSVSVYSICDKY